MKFQTHNDSPSINTNMSSLQGYIQATRAQLERVFGEPEEYDAESKVTTYWAVQFVDGTVATIYDWKRYEQGAPTADEVYDWHIGGHVMDAVAIVHESFREGHDLQARAA